ATPQLRSADVLATFRADLDRHRREVVEGWAGLDDAVLSARPAPRKWSAIDCLEHCRRANAMYLGHMDRAIAAAEGRGRRPVETFHPGLVGERMRRTLEPGSPAGDPSPSSGPADARAANAKRRIGLRMKTFGGYDPVKDATPPDPREALRRFDEQLGRMKDMAERMERVDLHTRTNTLVGPLLRLRIGDVARYLVAHTDRHLVQADRAIEGATSPRA
ncbi:MAG: DinB family protein, partial [Planctomycetota bacterium]